MVKYIEPLFEAGQLFGLLVGFGLALLKITMTKGTQAFKLFDPA
jgi:hypothetical protein